MFFRLLGCFVFLVFYSFTLFFYFSGISRPISSVIDTNFGRSSATLSLSSFGTFHMINLSIKNCIVWRQCDSLNCCFLVLVHHFYLCCYFVFVSFMCLLVDLACVEYSILQFQKFLVLSLAVGLRISLAPNFKNFETLWILTFYMLSFSIFCLFLIIDKSKKYTTF